MDTESVSSNKKTVLVSKLIIKSFINTRYMDMTGTLTPILLPFRFLDGLKLRLTSNFCILTHYVMDRIKVSIESTEVYT